MAPLARRDSNLKRYDSTGRLRGMESSPSIGKYDYPTILVAISDSGFSGVLAADLRHDGYLVLEAPSEHGVFSVLRTHSRPIHLMLTNISLDRQFMTELQYYRPKMNVLFVGNERCGHSPFVWNSEIALAQVRVFFEKSKPASSRGKIRLSQGQESNRTV